MIKVPLFPRSLKKLEGDSFETVPIDWLNFVEFCSKCFIRSGNEIKPFLLYPYQVKFAELIDKHSVIVCCKSRQLGITQVILAKFIMKALFNSAYVAVIFQRKQEDSSNIARRARQILESLKPYGIKNESDNLGYMKIKNGGEIHFKNSSKEGSRSFDSVSDFLYDESAFSENIKDIYSASSASSAMVENGCKIIVSTPNRQDGFYWDMLSNNNGFSIEARIEETKQGLIEPFNSWIDTEGHCKTLIHWKAHPIYSQHSDYLAYRMKQDGTDKETVLREYDLTFINTEESIFNPSIIRQNIDVIEDAEELEDSAIFMGLDCSTTGNDYTVLQVLKQNSDNTFSIIKTYRKRKETSEYHIFKISELIELYKPEIVAIEVTGGVGQLYLEQLSSLLPDIAFKAIKTTGDSKPIMINRLKLALERMQLKYSDNNPIIDELLSFRRIGKRLEASAGKHDDIVMSTCFALAVSPIAEDKTLKVKSFKELG